VPVAAGTTRAREKEGESVALSKIVRRTLWLLIALMVFSTAGGAIAQPSQLVVAVYGGEWGKKIEANIIKPFQQQSHANVRIEVGVSTVTLSKLEQQNGGPGIDVAWMDGGISEVAESKGVVAPIPPDQVPNIKEMYPPAVYKTSSGAIYALGTGWYALGLDVNKKDVQNLPTSWLDLWRSDLAGKVTIPSPANAMGLPLLVRIAELKGGSVNNIMPGLQAIRNLHGAVFYDTSGQATNLMSSGQTFAAADYASATWALADQGFPVTYVVPKEGAIAGDIRIHLVKGTANRALALKFINLAVSAAAQQGLANTLYVAPTNRHAAPSPAARMRMPWGATGSVKDLRFPNWNAINTQRTKLVDLWNRNVVR
jgi:putative spermidine/putrescine transport system substrate-binding protein